MLFINANAQVQSNKKTLTNEEIWGKNYFGSKSISGLNPMNDGKSYSSIYTDPISKKNTFLHIAMQQVRLQTPF